MSDRYLNLTVDFDGYKKINECGKWLKIDFKRISIGHKCYNRAGAGSKHRITDLKKIYM